MIRDCSEIASVYTGAFRAAVPPDYIGTLGAAVTPDNTGLITAGRRPSRRCSRSHLQSRSLSPSSDAASPGRLVWRRGRSAIRSAFAECGLTKLSWVRCVVREPVAIQSAVSISGNSYYYGSTGRKSAWTIDYRPGCAQTRRDLEYGSGPLNGGAKIGFIAQYPQRDA